MFNEIGFEDPTMLADRYDLPLSTVYAAVRDAYVQGCDLLLTLYPGAIEAFDRAIAAIPVSPWPMLARPRY